jgi:hypothetical protein
MADNFSPWVFFGFFAAPRQVLLLKLDEAIISSRQRQRAAA